MHRRKLKILDPCDRFQPRGRVSHCTHCDKDVHDLSRMTEPEARALLAASRGERLCVAYRTRADGHVVFRSPLATAGWLAAACLLLACAGTVSGDGPRGDVCFDALGQEVDCTDPVAGRAPRPHAASRGDAVDSGGGSCPAPQTAATRSTSEFFQPQWTDISFDENGAAHVRLDFAIDPDRKIVMGMFYGEQGSADLDGPYGRLHFRPTEELWSELAERIRQRRAERRRYRRRARRRTSP